MAPFDLPTNAGDRYDASAHLGKKALLIYFFATWYDKAPEELEALSSLVKGREADLEVITVAIDTAENRAKVDEFVKEHSVPFPVLLDPSGNLLETRYTGIAVAPQTLVVDRRGNLIATRGTDEDEDVPLADLVEALLAKDAGR